MSGLEQLPTTWDPDRDECFFRIVARVLPPGLVEAASSLLGSYDLEDMRDRLEPHVRWDPTPVRPAADADAVDRRRRPRQAPTGREAA